MVAGGIAATALLGPLGAAIVGGALISGGISAFTNKNADKSFCLEGVLWGGRKALWLDILFLVF
ncbi:Uncharacterised protein [Mycobacteroides abscessus subsp. bolletii]|nr:Uncharacterised protein [Mycobacteroides abscessus subsp. bolletii]